MVSPPVAAPFGACDNMNFSAEEVLRALGMAAEALSSKGKCLCTWFLLTEYRSVMKLRETSLPHRVSHRCYVSECSAC